jgi:hypothetical protein
MDPDPTLFMAEKTATVSTALTKLPNELETSKKAHEVFNDIEA